MESAIVDLPTGVCTFYMDQNEPLIPGKANLNNMYDFQLMLILSFQL